MKCLTRFFKKKKQQKNERNYLKITRQIETTTLKKIVNIKNSKNDLNNGLETNQLS